MTLEPNYTLAEVADALGMSERWVRNQLKDGAEHIRFGHKIKFTAAQVEALRAKHTTQPAPQRITTGRKRRTA